MTETVAESFLTGLPAFLLYFASGLVMLGIFSAIYIGVTPQKEIDLIKENKTSAAISFGGAILGFALPIAFLISQAFSILDFFLWSIAAGAVQLAAFFLFRLVFPKIIERITLGETAAPTALAAVHVVVGLVNAASLTY